MDKGEKLIKKPVYKGGKQAMKEFISKNLRYPEEAASKKIEGTVSVRIDIDQNGKVKKCKSIKKLGHGCDEEAERVCGMLEFYVDSKRRMKMTFHKTINVNFKLPRKKLNEKKTSTSMNTARKAPMQIVYTYVPSKKKG